VPPIEHTISQTASPVIRIFTSRLFSQFNWVLAGLALDVRVAALRPVVDVKPADGLLVPATLNADAAEAHGDAADILNEAAELEVNLAFERYRATLLETVFEQGSIGQPR
jgi:hypothetical protein